MIRHQLAIDEMLPADAYIRGWEDHADSLDAGADGEAALAASRSARHLDSLLDRVWEIAPWGEIPRREEEPDKAHLDCGPGSLWHVVESDPPMDRVFDWEER